VRMIESGPAAGVLGAAHIGRMTNQLRVISFDMGGTTAKAGIVQDGEPRIVPRFQAGEWLISTPSLDLVEIGAGGGSIAHVDEIGLLKVGPRSAGSQPGPAAYGLGGTEPTVTDADFVLGYLNPAYFAGGEVRVDIAAARAALERLAGHVGLSLTEVAWGIHDVVNESMAGAARVHIAERGRDPRDYTLCAFGGNGPVFACALAQELGMRKVLVPPSPGLFSAFGLLYGEVEHHYGRSFRRLLRQLDLGALDEAWGQLVGAARAQLTTTSDARPVSVPAEVDGLAVTLESLRVKLDAER